MGRGVTVRIQLSTERSVGSAFIRWYTWSAWSHVDFVLPGGNLLGARMNGGVQVRPPGYARFTHTLQLEAPDAPDTVYDRALEQVGKPYDIGAIAGMGLRRDWRDPLKWFCSELTAWAFEAESFPMLRTSDVYRVTPRDNSISPIFQLPYDYGVFA